MKWNSSRTPSASLLVWLGVAFVATQPAVAMLDCEHIQVDGHKFDLGQLKGPHSVVTTQHTPPTDQNSTYTLNLCGPLKRKGDVPKGEECPNGSWACAIKRFRKSDGETGIAQVIPLAGNLKDQGGGNLDHTVTRLRTSDSNADAQKEGLRLVLQGGRYPLDGTKSERQKQRVIVELLCDAGLEGTEGEWAVDEYEGGLVGNQPAGNTTSLVGRDEDKKEGGDDKKEGDGDNKDGDAPPSTGGPGEKQLVQDGTSPALVFESYDPNDADGTYGTLRLTWHTKFACENAAEPKKEHWGFFTWFVILVFLATASYLIFGSWLNYNRYGARGWDLLPHGDTLRDVPYLLKDWVRRLINTLQGSGSRGGYSAV